MIKNNIQQMFVMKTTQFLKFPDFSYGLFESYYTPLHKRSSILHSEYSPGCAYPWAHHLNWWQITLEKSYKIDHVMIYGMSDTWNNDEGVLNGAYVSFLYIVVT